MLSRCVFCTFSPLTSLFSASVFSHIYSCFFVCSACREWEARLDKLDEESLRTMAASYRLESRNLLAQVRRLEAELTAARAESDRFR